MRIALALVILGGLLYLEALRGWTLHRYEQLRAAFRELEWSSLELSASARQLSSALVASQHAWGNAVDIVLKHQESWHYHYHYEER
jgi:hypothetical protein